jgi:hypothetical protein
MSAGGVASCVDTATGIIYKSKQCGPGNSHTITDYKEQLGTISNFQRIPTYCSDLHHSKLDDIPTIGWDVALVEDGSFVIVEANMHTICYGTDLGDARERSQAVVQRCIEMCKS